MKILLSWIAFNNDFEQGKVNENGPTVSFHRHFYQYDQHWLLSTHSADDIRLTHLITHLRQSYPDRTIQLVYLSIRDVIDLSEIKPKIERLLVENSEHEMDIFISPGTPTMQVAWYLCHGSLGLKTRLLQTRAAKFTRSAKPELVEVNYETSGVPLSVMVREKQLNTKPNHQILETETMKPVYQRAYRIAQADGINTLILGATGTGKEHLAKYIHTNSARHAAPFVSVNCSAFTDSLLESRLFGHKKGSFTGADADHQGFLNRPKVARCFWTKSEIFLHTCSRHCCGYCRKKKSCLSAGRPKKLTCVSSLLLTAICMSAVRKERFAGISTTALRWQRSFCRVWLNGEQPMSNLYCISF